MPIKTKANAWIAPALAAIVFIAPAVHAATLTCNVAQY
jgi:hypothetical protein